MANKLDNLKPFKPMGKKALCSKTLGVKLEPELHEAIQSLPDRAAWLRRVISEAAQREGIYQPNEL